MDSEILQGRERTVFFRYLIPTMLSMVAVSAYSFTDTFVVGQGIGANAVAAMGVGTPVVSILYALGFLLGAGGAINYAVAKGSGDTEKAAAIFSAAFWSGIVLWIVIGVCGNIWIDEFADFLGATDGNHALTVRYLRWILSLSGMLILDLIMNNFMRNEGHPNVSMTATVTGTGLNIILDFVFVLVFGWGMDGAASATCLASVISVTINLTYAIGKHTGLIPRVRKAGAACLPKIAQIGFGSCVLEGAVAVISVVFLNFAGRRFGDAGVSSFSVLITLNLVVYSLLNGVAQAMQPLVSASYAAGDRKRMGRYVKYALLSSVVLGVVFFGLAELLPVTLVGLFVTDSDEIVAMSAFGLQAYAFSFLFMAVSIVLGIYFQSETRPLPALLILLGRSAVLPIIMLYVLAWILGADGIWYAVSAGEGLAMVLACILYAREQSRASGLQKTGGEHV